ncbi:MAG: hypothetical protein WDW36_000197 [Sanguina aurantia]
MEEGEEQYDEEGEVGGLACGAFCHITLDPADIMAAAQLHPPEALALRFCLGVSMLLLAGAAHTLLDFAWRTRSLTAVQFAQMEVIDKLGNMQDKRKYINVPPTRFEPLTLGVLLPTASQAALLLHAINLGVDVNTDVWLWGPLFGSTALSAVLFAVMVTRFNMDSVFMTLRSMLLTVAGVVDWTFRTFVYRWEWTKDHRAVGGKNIRVEPFISSLFQWASTLTQSGANYPFALPLAMDKLGSDGFKIALLKRTTPGFGGAFDAAASIVTTVETLPNQGKVLMIRLYEGPAAQTDRRTPASENERERLETLLSTLVDVPIIMQTMPTAITAAIRSST